jgi:hypothetical protein
MSSFGGAGGVGNISDTATVDHLLPFPITRAHHAPGRLAAQHFLQTTSGLRLPHWASPELPERANVQLACTA